MNLRLLGTLVLLSVLFVGSISVFGLSLFDAPAGMTVKTAGHDRRLYCACNIATYTPVRDTTTIRRQLIRTPTLDNCQTRCELYFGTSSRNAQTTITGVPY